LAGGLPNNSIKPSTISSRIAMARASTHAGETPERDGQNGD
jgi:hypothetical protein